MSERQHAVLHAVVQAVCASALDAAAACGATVFTLHLTPEAGLRSASRRPALPSVVADLCLVAPAKASAGAAAAAAAAAAAGEGGGAHALVAGTLHSGVYVWSGAQLADATAPATLWLDCRSSVEGVSCSPALAWPYLAHCRDRTARLWGLPNAQSPPARQGRGGQPPRAKEEEEEEPPLVEGARAVVPMTFGGLSPGLRTGAQFAVISFAPAVGLEGSQGSQVVLCVADGAAGVVAWTMEPPGTAKGTDDAALGIDSRRARRLTLPAGRRALCIAARPAGAPAGASAAEAEPAAHASAPALLACGCDRGQLVLLRLDRDSAVAVDVGAASAKPSGTQAPPATILQVAESGNVGMVAWSEDGAWLYAASRTGVCCVAVPAMSGAPSESAVSLT